jgi:hypothetical protein
MNFQVKGKNIDWKRIAGIAIVVLIVGYQYSRPHLERFFERDLPSISGEDDRQNGSNGPSATASRDNDSRYDAQLPSSSSRGQTQSNSNSNSGKNQSGDFLRSVGKNRFESPAGLVYTMGPRGEHRVDHVLRHGRDMPERPVHSVFDGGRNDILAVIDEAYSLVKSNSPRARSSNSRGNDEHTVRMQRKVGYEGGQKGKRKGYPALENVKLILDGNRVITAYPSR